MHLLSTMLRQNFYVRLYCLLLLSCQLYQPAVADTKFDESAYIIVLASAPGKNLTWQPKKHRLFDGYSFYTEKTIIRDSKWERLCLGFFNHHKEASSLLKKVQVVYPGSWIKKVSADMSLSDIKKPDDSTTLIRVEKKRDFKRNTGMLRETTSLSEKQLDSLMQRAKKDFKNKEYSSSIRYLNALIEAGDNKYSRESLEYLGLARHRKGQVAHAISTYEKYLKIYPEGDASVRVSQRLAGVLTAADAPRKKMRMETAEEKAKVITYGSLSQFYQSNHASVDDVGNVSTLSQLITFVDLTALHETSKFNHRYQLTADHVYDSIDNNDKSTFRFIDAYYEIGDQKTGSSVRFGRQRINIGGILNRFDGASLGYQFNPDMRLNFLSGFPVDVKNKTSINNHKVFYGFTFETGTFLDHWNMNLFYFDQDNDGLTESNNAGTEINFRDNGKLLYGLIDYDLFYEEINILQLNANINFERGRAVYVNAFMRKSPLIATTNALIGRQEQSIEALSKVLNVEQIYQLARDRTANSETVTIGGVYPISKRYQLTTDITFSHIDGTSASGGVPEVLDTGTDYFLSAQIVGRDLWMKQDVGILGMRFYDTAISKTISLIGNARFLISKNWRINPRLQFDMRDLNDGLSQNKIRVILRTDYRYLHRVRFDFEIGLDKVDEDTNNFSLANNNLFFTLGYRWDF